jgi:hypothetical protein
MNFRVTMPHQEVLDCCKESKFNQILANDEFRVLHAKTGMKKIRIDPSKLSGDLGDVYSNFKEADITFPPTYKFDLRDVDTYAKHRIPSYTVRMCFRILTKINI